MKYVAFVFLCGALCRAGQAHKPICNAKSHGQLWPEDANSNRDSARELSQKGELEMCTAVAWRYKWRRLSVNVRDLVKAKRP